MESRICPTFVEGLYKISETDLLPVPEGIDPLDAESLIVNGITAWQMLHKIAKVEAGQTILVHGANGGVGTILTQLAQLADVTVVVMTTLARSLHIEYLNPIFIL
ncbi:hypothetical protein [Dyadobacter sp. 3J3]|uniref:hypothetical protein n=1 Tax=Dyadobacter sp. 3J3 TaxID=2606600 RepID=UPI001E519B5A|nr:hypothetical protein [Dyadobacter sp. 3J3]